MDKKAYREIILLLSIVTVIVLSAVIYVRAFQWYMVANNFGLENTRLDWQNVPLEQPVTTIPQAVAAVEKVAKDWDKRAMLTNFSMYFDTPQDVKDLNVSFSIYYCFSWSEPLTGAYRQDGCMITSILRNSSEIESVTAHMGGILGVRDEELVMDGHILTVEDIPRIMNREYGEDWAKKYGDMRISVEIFGDHWSFEFYSGVTKERHYLYVNPFAGEVISKKFIV